MPTDERAFDERAPIDPERTGLVLFDLLERYRPGIEEAGAIAPCQRLIAACRVSGVPLFYARADHRPDGADLASASTDADAQFRAWTDDYRPPTLPGLASGSFETQVVAELAPQPGDYDIPKHRWNAFFQTCLELSLRTQGINTVLIVGGSTHVGIASTVYYGRDADFDMVVVRDGLTGFREQREFFVDKVFPRVCRVRTTDQVVADLTAAPSA